MANEPSKVAGPFDMRTIKDLVALMGRHELTEIDLREGELRIRLRRGPKESITLSPMPAAMPPAPAAAPSPPPSTSSKPAAANPAKDLLTIKSPTPGTFYSASSPDAEPFVRVGSRVTSTTVVCLIEAMKIFNEITADCNGVITEVLAENQQPVEYGQVLFKVDPAG
ncbi:MAG TPA: acetyl-CoA carboxylase biotin carboxyl carrier protein [Gemmataceae bacterium]|nr:acetyl-CoA carboxylase biotin carboxyl carrier protein [Gemmataceae bacterium]